MVTYTSQVRKQHLFPSAQNIEVNNHVVKANMSLSPHGTVNMFHNKYIATYQTNFQLSSS